jgi:hypothetical protein
MPRLSVYPHQFRQPRQGAMLGAFDGGDRFA